MMMMRMTMRMRMRMKMMMKRMMTCMRRMQMDSLLDFCPYLAPCQ